MKHALLPWLLILLFAPLMAFAQRVQPGHFSREWKQVDSLEKAGLYRSAWTAARRIYAAATARHQDQEQIKALIYGLKYRSRISEDAEGANIREVDSLSRAATQVPRAILQSMLAEMYQDYAAAHRYALYSRLSSSTEDTADIATWSLRHLDNRIAALYEASLRPASALKEIRLADMHVLVDTGVHALRLRPTLYDLLARRALDYFSSADAEAIVPAGQFTIDAARAFAPPAEFVDLTFSPQDTTSSRFKAFHLFQELIRFHLKDSDRAALGDVNLDRLQFVHSVAVMPGKDSLYVHALRRVLQRHPDRLTLTAASSLLARWYKEQGSRYDAFVRPQYRYDLKKALEICRSVPAGPVTSGSRECKELAASILRPELSLKAEQVNLPDQPFRVLVAFRNASRLWFRLVKLPEAPAQVFGHEYPDRNVLNGMEAFRQWEQDFPDQGDYQSHSAEMKVDGLPHGRYALMVSPDSSFHKGKYPIERVVFFVSGISCVNNNRGDYVVVDRETGKPLRKATVRLWTVAYDADSGKSVLRDLGEYDTDRNGYFHCDSTENLVMPEISYHHDHLYTGRPQYVSLVASDTPRKDTVEQKAWLFTDRSIYRPGQTLYFKGVVFGLDPHTRESHVLTDRKVKVFLLDAGGRKADSLQLTTNDFGSYTGHFLLPSGSLNGSMRLEAKPGDASAYFSVEDYKRPGFYIRWDTAGRQYRLGDTVDVAGHVAAYTQAVVGGATVSYQVFRRTRMRFFPLRRGRSLIGYPQQAAVAQDTTSTDAAGRFSIRFPAVPDPEADSSLDPVFDYIVSVQVTDINGETRTASYTIPLGYQSLRLEWEVPQPVPAAADTLRLKSSDLSGAFVPVEATIKVFPLVAPARYIRPRYWQRPDTHLMDRKTYLSFFPHDEYDQESEPESWPREPAVLTLKSTTRADGALLLHAASLATGWYAVQATASDRYGRTVTAVKYVQVYGTEKPAFSTPLWSSAAAVQAQPGQPATWKIAADRRSFVFRQEERLKGTRSPVILKLKRGIQSQRLAVDTGDRGGVIMHYFTVKDDRLYSRDVRIEVPWEDKELHFTYTTFRDSLLPGAEESWSVKISGKDNGKGAAEVLASMYDASLDAFRPHEWIEPPLYPVLQGKVSWERAEEDALSSSSVYQPPFSSFPGYELEYPSLRWFGYRPAGRRPIPLAMAGAVRESAVREATNVQFKKQPAPATADTAPVAQIPVVPEVRKDFRETAFFLPQLRTDDSGSVIFSFKMPEALTTWKLMLFAHTRDLRYGFSSRKVITQKPLMIQAAAPRFVRQGDSLLFTAKISNLSAQDLSGLASLQLSDPVSGENVDSLFGNLSAPFAYRVRAGSSIVASWAVAVPDDYTGALQYRLTADAGNYRDGEQNAIPVLSNRALFTESLPLHFRGNGSWQVQWDVLKRMKQSGGGLPSGLTVTCATNPVWYAVLALPLLDENDRQSADVLFDQLYARSLSSYILGRNPGFSSVLDRWIAADTAALKSPLQENQGLKTVLLQETPWVQAAVDEATAKAEVAQWYRKSGHKPSLQEAVDRLKAMQLATGAFPWFHGTAADDVITRRILTGLGHLEHLGAWPEGQREALSAITAKGVPYLDGRMKTAYDQLMKRKQGDRALSPGDVAYLYMRSFFPGLKMADSAKPAYVFYKDLARKEWTTMSPYLQAMVALALYRSGDIATSEAILRSLSEQALHDKNGGMYWKENTYGYLWYNAPLEAESICIEAFDEIAGDSSAVADICNWLLGQKQAEGWPTNRATAHAVYALLLGGRQWTTSSPAVKISLDGRTVDSTGGPGAGYSRAFIAGADITPAMGNVTVSVEGAAQGQSVWVSLYYQYLGSMEEAANSGAGLSISRQISLEKPSPQGPELLALKGGEPLHTGDRVQVRMVVKAERDLDYVHLKDVRASCMEPVQTLSGYQGGQGTFWYSTVAGAGMHFYFRHLSRGTYVFTYPVFISRAGSFAGGMSTIECLYAPEFRAHSEGVKVNVGQ